MEGAVLGESSELVSAVFEYGVFVGGSGFGEEFEGDILAGGVGWHR